MTATTDGGAGAAGPATAEIHRTATARATAATAGTDLRTAAETAMRRSVDHLLGRQDAGGWWKGDLETNVTMDAEDLLLRQFLGIRDDATTEAAALFVRGEQRDDGTWATFHGGPGDLSATIEAYVALRLAGDAPDA
ncbi:squalene--hopene cyclase, partial [Streptomyces somaliensis DSM 40738]|nr:squalene--hopene cyclase [Streptomyces somaliensis DSM 40738]